jgi:monooxygenase
MPDEHLDVLIVGAGLSGVGAAHYLQERCPRKSFAILEARSELGGTWDLFRYPGIRSDSDMNTLGYRFKPWTERKALADGPSILRYIRETAEEDGTLGKIRFHHRVAAADYVSAEQRWHVDVERADTGEALHLTCDFLYVCSGYYRYDEGYTPDLPGIERFRGQVVHPQQWPEDLDYEGKRIVIIGSGATAVTLLPALAEKAGHVTQLQRSPTYVVSIPNVDPIANFLHRWLPTKAAYVLVRWKNVALQSLVYQLSRRRPQLMRKLLRKGVVKALPPGYPVDVHFNPRYNPWDQRLCAVPDGDLFKALSDGSAEIVTDTIETFTERGIELDSGKELEADIVITATGLNLRFLGGAKLSVDGVVPDVPHAMAYKGMMLSDIPNMAFTLGYTNSSWTLKADLVAEYVCRLLNHMDAHGYTQCVPKADPSVEEVPLLDFPAGYVLRHLHELPKQGSREPWNLRMNYPLDLRALRYGPVEDSAMRFSRPVREGAGEDEKSEAVAV